MITKLNSCMGSLKPVRLSLESGASVQTFYTGSGDWSLKMAAREFKIAELFDGTFYVVEINEPDVYAHCDTRVEAEKALKECQEIYNGVSIN